MRVITAGQLSRTATPEFDADAEGSEDDVLRWLPRDHEGVAVDAGSRWVLHAGDAFYHPGVIDGRTAVPLALRLQDRLAVFDRKRLQDNQNRLAELYARSIPTC